jgi:hypothetical protein
MSRPGGHPAEARRLTPHEYAATHGPAPVTACASATRGW